MCANIFQRLTQASHTCLEGHTWRLIAILYHSHIDFPQMTHVVGDVIDVTLSNVVRFYQNADVFIPQNAHSSMPYSYLQILAILFFKVVCQ